MPGKGILYKYNSAVKGRDLRKFDGQIVALECSGDKSDCYGEGGALIDQHLPERNFPLSPTLSRVGYLYVTMRDYDGNVLAQDVCPKDHVAVTRSYHLDQDLVECMSVRSATESELKVMLALMEKQQLKISHQFKEDGICVVRGILESVSNQACLDQSLCRDEVKQDIVFDPKPKQCVYGGGARDSYKAEFIGPGCPESSDHSPSAHGGAGMSFEETDSTLINDLTTLGKASLYNASITALSEAIGDTLYLTGLASENNAEKIKKASQLMVIYLTGSWLSTGAAWVTSKTLEKTGLFSKRHAQFTGQAVAIGMNLGVSLFTPMGAATTAVGIASSRFGLWAEKKVIARIAHQQAVNAPVDFGPR